MVRDLLIAVRSLFRSPGFTLTGIVVLAVAIGADTAIFSLVDAELLRPLPYPQPGQLVLLEESNHQKHLEHFKFAPADFIEIRHRSGSFSAVASYDFGSMALTGREEPERLEGAVVSSDFFRVLGVSPLLGRGFLPDDDSPGEASHVAVLSHGFWQRDFGADPGVLGRPLVLDGENYTVIGVLPAAAAFSGLESEGADIWVPAGYDSKYLSSHGHEIGVIARLRPDTSLATARAEMQTFSRQLELKDPSANEGWSIDVSRLDDRLVGKIRPVLLVLLAAVAFVLLIAIVNMASLLAARAFLKNREVAVKLSLGAAKAVIVRQFITESMLVSIVGGGCGVALAYFAVPALLRFTSFSLPVSVQPGVDWRVLAFAFVLCMITGLAFGLFPALLSFRAPIMRSLREAAGTGTSSRRGRNWQRALLLSEMTFTMVLLIGAGTSIKSFYRILHTQAGFDPQGVLSMRISLPDSRYGKSDRVLAFVDGLLQRVRALPGVRSAGLSHTFPLTHDMTFSFTVRGSAPVQAENTPVASVFCVTPGYLRAMGISLLQGRDFMEGDREGALPVAIVNETFAHRYFPGRNAVGGQIKEGSFDSSSPWMTVVGVVRDVRQYGLTQPVPPQLYESFYQRPFRFMTLAVRGKTGALPAPSVQRQVYLQDPAQPVYEVETMDHLLSASLARWKVSMSLMSIFALVSLVLAATGLYGVVTYSISQRRRELGLRMALGSSRRTLLKLLLGEAMILSATAALLGAAVSMAMMRSLSAIVVALGQARLSMVLSAGLVMVAVSALSAFAPAAKIAAIDPTRALRAE